MIFHWDGKVEGPKAESGGGVHGEGQEPPSHQLGDLRERCERRGSGGAPTAQRLLLSACRMASPYTRVLLILCTSASIS